jgi:predicted phage-related endonuclease
VIGGRPDLVAVELDPETQREDWVASRLLGIGGSDAAAVVGEHPQKSAIDVFLERTTGATDFLDNERTEMGRILEPIVLDLFASGPPRWPRDPGPYVIAKPPSVFQRDKPWRRGSADGFGFYPEAVVDCYVDGVLHPATVLSRRPNFLVEVKTHGWFGSRAYDLDEDGDAVVGVPPDKRIQCAWYMALYDVDLTYLVCLVDTHLRRTFAIRRDRELEGMLLEAVDRFWYDHVLTGDPPVPDGSRSYRRYLRDRFGSHSAELVGSSPQVEAAIATLLPIKRQQDLLKKDRELAEQVLKRHIGDACGVRTALGPVTWKSQASGKLRDRDARAELYAATGWTDDEIAAFEERLKQPDHRVLRTPK